MTTSTTTATATMSSSTSTLSTAVTVGIDIGTESIKTVLGPMFDYELVRDATGGHSMPAAVTFKPGPGCSASVPDSTMTTMTTTTTTTTPVEAPPVVRLIGEEASDPKYAGPDTVLHIIRTLPGGGAGSKGGIRGDGGDALGEFYRFRCSLLPDYDNDSDDNGASATVTIGGGGGGGDDNGTERTFSSPALLAMLLGRVKSNVDATIARLGHGGGGNAADAESSTPRIRYAITLSSSSNPDVDARAKRVLLDAAYAAGMGVGNNDNDNDADAVVVLDPSDCLAAAYGRKWGGTLNESEVEEVSGSSEGGNDRKKDGRRTVAVVDMGHSRTTVSILLLGGKMTEGDGDGSGTDSNDVEMEGSSVDGAAPSDQDQDEKKDEADGADKKTTENNVKTGRRLGNGGGGVEVLASASSFDLGAGHVDVRLFRHFASTTSGLSDIVPSSRRGQRLLAGCRKLKHLLSMLPSGSVTIECVAGNDERDVQLNATRDVLNDLCRDEATKLKELIATALEKALGAVESEESHISFDSVDSIEILGGGCRIPLFQETILSSFGKTKNDGTSVEKDLSRGLDDTSLALGAAAILSNQRGDVDVDDVNKMDVEPIDADATRRRQQLREDEARMAAYDADMSRRSEARNAIEAHVLQMRSARNGSGSGSNGTHGHLLPDPSVLDPYLDNLDEWLYSDECDNLGPDEMVAKLNDVIKTTGNMCEAYFRAVKEESEKKNRELEEEARRAEEEKKNASNDDDNYGDGADGDDHDTRRLPKKRRMEIVLKNKNEANELLKDGNYRHAAARYHKALTHCGKFHDVSPDDESEIKSVKLSLYLNLALAYIKLDKPDNALRSCNDALGIDPDNVKALYRRATVYFDKKRWHDAMSDAQRAAVAAPDDKAVKKLQAKIEQQLKREKAKEIKMAQKMFG